MKDQDQDLLSHLLRNLTSTDGSNNGRNISGLLPGFQDLQNAGMSLGTPEKFPDLISNGPKCTSMLGSISKKDVCIDIQDPLQPNGQCMAFEGTEKRTITDNTQGGLFQTPYAIPCPTRDNIPAKASVPDNGVGRMKLNDIDLNTVYDDSQDCSENLESYHAPVNLGLDLFIALYGDIMTVRSQALFRQVGIQAPHPPSHYLVRAGRPRLRVAQIELFSNSLEKIQVISLLSCGNRYLTGYLTVLLKLKATLDLAVSC